MSESSFKDDSESVTHVAVISVFSFFAIVSVILRLWSRRLQRNAWDLSDYSIIAGLVSGATTSTKNSNPNTRQIWAMSLAGFTIHSAIYDQLGDDVSQRGNPKAVNAFVVYQLKALLVGQITWTVSVFFIRASVLALYLRIFSSKKPFRIAGHTLFGVNAAFFISTVLAVLLICRPIAFGWDRTIKGGTCGDQKSLDIYIGILNLLLDVAVVILPMPVLWGLQMALSRKVQLSGMFGLGIIICVLTLVRVKISSENHVNNAQEVYSQVAFYTNLEALLGVINACLPVMKPVFMKLHSSKASSLISSFMSASIPVVLRLSHISKASSSKQKSTHKSHSSQEPRPWPSNDAMSLELQQTPPPQYTDDISPTKSPASTPKSIRNVTIRSETPSVPSPKNRRILSPTRNEQGHVDDAMSGIYVERSWDVDVERGGSAESDRQVLVRDGKGW
ncbi:hypothetical protein ACLMJK_008973 [Lecanora helva]